MRYLFFLLLLTGCSKTLILEKSEVTGIPGGSDAVIVNAPYSADSLFSVVSKSFGGKWIVRSSKEAMQISCEPKIVKGNIYIRPVVHIESSGPGKSRAIYSGVWSSAPMDQEKIDYILASKKNTIKKITWDGYNTQGGLAFQNLIVLGRRVSGGRISYTK